MKISFVVPAYNAAAFIAKCLDSIRDQKFSNFEVLIINDGSTDDTQSVIDSYVRQDNRFHCITVPNGGQGAARSLGILRSTGDYIWFVDSDDWLVPDSLLRITRILREQAPDVMVLNYEYTFDHAAPVPANVVPSHLAGTRVDPLESAGTFASISCWNTPPWRLLSRRQHLIDHTIQFASGVFYEDHPFAIHLMLTARNVYLDAPVSYAYFQRATSTTKVNDKKALDFITIRRQCLALFERFGVLHTLAPVAAGYVTPVNFYRAHVSEPFRREFISRLHQEFTQAEYAFIEQYGDADSKEFSKAVKANSAELFEHYLQAQKPRRRYNVQGAKNLLGRVKQKALQKAATSAHHLKSALFSRGQHSGIDTTGRRFMTVGQGTRIEPIMIDVRVRQENRSYVEVGEQSHVGGTFVFERGVGKITIGNRSSIGGGCKLICSQEGGISIGNNVMLSWDCTLMDSNAHSLDPDIRANDAYDWKCGVDSGRVGVFKDWSQVASAPIVIEDKVWIGFEVAVMKGVTIGEGAVIGSRSLVSKDVAAYCVYAGAPAKFVSLVPRERWPYHDLVRALQGDPSYDKLLRDAYMHRDVLDCFERFRASDEFRETVAKVKAFHPQATSLLDVGGGSGFAAIAFAAEGFNVTLVEPSSDKVVGVGAAQLILEALEEETPQRFPGIGERVELICADAEVFDFVGRNFDVVYLRQVVHHLPNAAVSVARLANTLRPGGLVMFIREHVVFDAQDKQLFLEHHPLHAFTLGENAYTVIEYQQIIRSANLTLLETIGFADSVINYFPHSLETAQRVGEAPVYGRPYSFFARKDA